MPAETPLATWQHAGVAYAVAAIAVDDGPLLVVVAASGPGTFTRSAHEVRPNDAAEVAQQLTRWNAATDLERTCAAEQILARG